MHNIITEDVIIQHVLAKIKFFLTCIKEYIIMYYVDAQTIYKKKTFFVTCNINQ